MSTYKQQLTGFVLHGRAYRETSMLLDFFTEEQGKVSAVGKGIRNAKSDKKSLVQPLQMVSFELSGRGGLKNLGRIDAHEKSINLVGNMLYCSLYINELLSRALPENESFSTIFTEYQSLLAKLKLIQDAEKNSDMTQIEALKRVEPILRSFEFVLLETLGYLPDLSIDSDNETAIINELTYQFNAEHGLVQSKVLRQGMLGQHINDMLAQKWYPESLKVAKRISRIALHPLLGNKPLKSRELFALNPTKT